MTQQQPLNHFGFLRISGPDSITFMQGYATCDLAAIEDGSACMGAVCNLKGRMIASFLAVREGSDLLLRLHRDLVPELITFLGKYIVFSKAEMSDISDTFACYGIVEASDKAVFTVEKPTDSEYLIHLGNRQEHWAPADAQAAADATPDEAALQWATAEIEAGVVWVTPDTREEYIPQMFNYHTLGAIDFDKGCYLGQEIVARMQYRGELKRRLHHLQSSTSRQVGDKLQVDNRNLGELVAVAGQQLLAVIQHAEPDPLGVQFDDGEVVSASPI